MYTEMRGREDCQVEDAEWRGRYEGKTGTGMLGLVGRRSCPQRVLRSGCVLLTLLPIGREQKCKQITPSQGQDL